MRLRRKSNHELLTFNSQKFIGEGGEARVYLVPNQSRLVAKVYHRPTFEHKQKLQAMLARPPVDPMAAKQKTSIAWPLDLLLAENDATYVAGFLMPNVADMRRILEFYVPSTRLEQCPLFDYFYLHQTARNLASCVSAVHQAGHIIGDVNESNILANEETIVALVDTDSFQICDPAGQRVFRCLVGKPEFTPPEIQGKAFADYDRAVEQDLFGLAVVIFRLLMEGSHPFEGVYAGAGEPPPLEDRIAAGIFAYGVSKSPLFRPRRITPPFELLHPPLQRLFVRCFEDGHRNPAARPKAMEWLEALEEATGRLRMCGRNDKHRYGEHLPECPWCARIQSLGVRDPFPSTSAVQQGLHLRRAPAPLIPSQTPRPPVRPVVQPAPVTAPPTPVRKHRFAPVAALACAAASFWPGLYWLTVVAGMLGIAGLRGAYRVATAQWLSGLAVGLMCVSVWVNNLPVPHRSTPNSANSNAPAALKPPVADTTPAPPPALAASNPVAAISSRPTNLPSVRVGSPTVATNTPATPPNPHPELLVWIAPGNFTMGSPATEKDRYDDEGPPTQVTLTKGFWMSRYLVTQDRYLAVMGSNPSHFTGDLQRPVETVSWLDATNYCAKLTDQERRAGRLPAGYAYRLPTEAEWEYACRAATQTRFSYGDDPDYSQLGEYAWYTGNSDSSTHPVGGKKPNPWGLYDMQGNVWEWCLDWQGGYTGGSVTDPRGPAKGSYRVRRGGSWFSVGRLCRSAYRSDYAPVGRLIIIGFRPVLAPGQ